MSALRENCACPSCEDGRLEKMPRGVMTSRGAVHALQCRACCARFNEETGKAIPVEPTRSPAAAPRRKRSVKRTRKK